MTSWLRLYLSDFSCAVSLFLSFPYCAFWKEVTMYSSCIRNRIYVPTSLKTKDLKTKEIIWSSIQEICLFSLYLPVCLFNQLYISVDTYFILRIIIYYLIILLFYFFFVVTQNWPLGTLSLSSSFTLTRLHYCGIFLFILSTFWHFRHIFRYSRITFYFFP